MNHSKILVITLCGLLAAASAQAVWYSPILRFGQTVKAQILQHKKIGAIASLAVSAIGLGYFGFTKLRDMKIRRLVIASYNREKLGLEPITSDMANKQWNNLKATNYVLPEVIHPEGITRKIHVVNDLPTEVLIDRIWPEEISRDRAVTLKKTLRIDELFRPVVQLNGCTWGKDWKVTLIPTVSNTLQPKIKLVYPIVLKNLFAPFHFN